MRRLPLLYLLLLSLSFSVLAAPAGAEVDPDEDCEYRHRDPQQAEVGGLGPEDELLKQLGPAQDCVDWAEQQPDVHTDFALYAADGPARSSEATTGAVTQSHGYCVSAVDTPHYSKGAAGIIVKGRTTCHENVDRVILAIQLFLCPEVPKGPEEKWESEEGCVVAGSNSRIIYDPPNGERKRIYAPPKVYGGAHGKGYWIGCMRTTTYKNGGRTQDYYRAGPIWYGAG